jgi:hypothetical protein
MFGYIKTLTAMVAMSLVNVSLAESMSTVLTSPCSYQGLIQFNQQVYYAGDKLEIQLVLPEPLKALLSKEAEAQILVYFPQGEVEAFPIQGAGQFLAATIESAKLATGDYQLALVFTQPGGDAVKIADWYNGFSGFTSFGQMKISGGIPGAEPNDLDGDGMLDNQAQSDNSSKNIEEVTGTAAVCVEEGAMTRRAETDSSLTPTDVLATTATDFQLKPAVGEAMKMLHQLKILTGEYYADRGELPSRLEQIMPFVETTQSVAHITLNQKNGFFYQLTLKSEAEGIEPALANKHIKFAYDQTTNMWRCGPGTPNGLENKYLPAGCR